MIVFQNTTKFETFDAGESRTLSYANKIVGPYATTTNIPFGAEVVAN